MKRERVDELPPKWPERIWVRRRGRGGGKGESCIGKEGRIVNNKGIPKGESSQIERGEER